MESPKTRDERIGWYRRMLERAGYVPEVYPGEVRFKHEGGTYQILAYDDQTYVAVVFPRFWSFKTPEERARAVVAACATTTGTKAAKVLLTEDNHVSAAVELFCSPPEALEPVLDLAITSLKYAVKSFKEQVAAS
ncbi:MAG TPA: hypothetical protein VJU15_06830 [Gemmatimonadales bacterium]|nr:hypothetical protein [Gemmatimonadales bacterium]